MAFFRNGIFYRSIATGFPALVAQPKHSGAKTQEPFDARIPDPASVLRLRPRWLIR